MRAWLLLPAVLLLAGCGAPQPAEPEQDSEGRYVIHLTAGNRFEPKEARVPLGATVLWVVEGGAHDVQVIAPGDELATFSTGYDTLLGPGDSFQAQLNETGKWTVLCHAHQGMGMTSTIHVKEA